MGRHDQARAGSAAAAAPLVDDALWRLSSILAIVRL
jgi:hypothetical protein